MFLSLFPGAVYAENGGDLSAEEILTRIGLLRGTGDGIETERPATRAEAAVMALRLAGEESAAKTAGIASPYDDGGWADIYLGYADSIGLVHGVAEHWFDSEAPVSARDYVTMVLRVLGYREGLDFTWNGSLVYARGLGLTWTGESETVLVRSDMAAIACSALGLHLKNSTKTLLSSLSEKGAVDPEAAAVYMPLSSGKAVYTAEELYGLCAPAVLTITRYKTEEDYKKQEKSGSGSGFLFSESGLAVLDFHEMDGGEVLTASTTDGHVYPVVDVRYYDVLRDVAVVQLSMTDVEGQARTAFPTLRIGDSEVLRPGEPAYLIANPMEFERSITQGIVSYPSRVLDDPDYPYVQTDAAASQGSSGGPMLNRFGEVVGIVYGSYVVGQSLNFMTPINWLHDVKLDSPGVSVKELRKLIAEKRAAAEIVPEVDEVTLKVGEKRTLSIYTDYPGELYFVGVSSDPECMTLSWGDYITKQSAELILEGIAPGTSTATLSFSLDAENEDATAYVHVTVTE